MASDLARASAPSSRRVDGERIIFWCLPAVAVTWLVAFFLFPGFVPPMSPEATADEVAAFYRENLSQVRYSMILFNWFGVALIPVVLLIAERMRGMAHRTPVLRYCVIGVAGGAPNVFLTSTVFWTVIAVIALIPCAPARANALRSAWMPAPPPESEPAIVRSRGGWEGALIASGA